MITEGDMTYKHEIIDHPIFAAAMAKQDEIVTNLQNPMVSIVATRRGSDQPRSDLDF